jgi:hypothetical protein
MADDPIDVWATLRAIGIFPTLDLTSAQVRALSPDDEAMLRGLGASDRMLAAVRDQAREPDRCFRLDFERQAVRVVDPPG